MNFYITTSIAIYIAIVGALALMIIPIALYGTLRRMIRWAGKKEV